MPGLRGSDVEDDADPLLRFVPTAVAAPGSGGPVLAGPALLSSLGWNISDLCVALQPPSVTLQLPSVTLQPPSVTLQALSVTLQQPPAQSDGRQPLAFWLFHRPPPPPPSRRGAQQVGEIRRSCQKPKFWVQHRLRSAKQNGMITTQRTPQNRLCSVPTPTIWIPPSKSRETRRRLVGRRVCRRGGGGAGCSSAALRDRPGWTAGLLGCGARGLPRRAGPARGGGLL